MIAVGTIINERICTGSSQSDHHIKVPDVLMAQKPETGEPGENPYRENMWNSTETVTQVQDYSCNLGP